MKADRKKAGLTKALSAAAAVLAALLLISGALFLVKSALKARHKKIDYTEKQESIEYYSASPASELTPDAEYAEMDKEVFFFDDTGFGENLTEEDAAADNARGAFYNYFEALKSGDAAKHAALLSEDYKKNFAVQTSFTPQMVYDIKAEFMRADYDGEKCIEKYLVCYKIHKNDGSYRADLGSDEAKQMVFEIVRSGKKALINAIVPVRSK